MTLLTPITQIPQTFTRFHQSVNETLERQSTCTAKQERVLDRLQTDTKNINDRLGQLGSLQETMVSRISQSVRDAVSATLAADVGNMATQTNSTLTEAFKETFSQLIPDLQTVIDERVAKLEQSLLESIMRVEAVAVPEKTVLASKSNTTDVQALQHSTIGSEQDTPPDPSNILAARRKRRISISSEPDCDLVTCLEAELPPSLAEHDVSIAAPAGTDLETHGNTLPGEQTAVSCGIHISPDDGGDTNASHYSLLPFSAVHPITMPHRCGQHWNSTKERRKRRRLTLSPVLDGEHSLV